MKKLPASVSTLLILGLGTLLTIAVIKGRPTTKPSEIEPKQLPIVAVVAVEPQNKTLSVYSHASVQSSQRIQLNTRVAGTIQQVSDKFIVGAALNKGDLLASLDDIEYRNALSQAKLKVAQAKEQLASEQALAKQAEGRWRDLGNKSANDFFLRKPQLTTAKAQVSAAEIGVELAQTNVNHTKITAPFKGRIATINANVGQFLNAGSPLAEMYSIELLQLLVPLTKQQLVLLSLDDYETNTDIQVVVTEQSTTNANKWQAKLIGIDGNVNVNTRLYNAVVEVQNQSAPYLVPGLFVDVQFQSATHYSQVTLPTKSLVDSNYVYVVIDNSLHKKPIQLLGELDNSIIVGGLSTNDKVVISRPLWTVEGSDVKTTP